MDVSSALASHLSPYCSSSSHSKRALHRRATHYANQRQNSGSTARGIRARRSSRRRRRCSTSSTSTSRPHVSSTRRRLSSAATVGSTSMNVGPSSSTPSMANAGEAGPSQPSSPRRPEGQGRRTPRSNSALYAAEDDSVVMRDRAHRNSGAAAEREEVISTGKAGGVSGGVTRPKRRLSR